MTVSHKCPQAFLLQRIISNLYLKATLLLLSSKHNIFKIALIDLTPLMMHTSFWASSRRHPGSWNRWWKSSAVGGTFIVDLSYLHRWVTGEDAVSGGLGFVFFFFFLTRSCSTRGEILEVTFNRKIYTVMTQCCWEGDAVCVRDVNIRLVILEMLN